MESGGQEPTTREATPDLATCKVHHNMVDTVREGILLKQNLGPQRGLVIVSTEKLSKWKPCTSLYGNPPHHSLLTEESLAKGQGDMHTCSSSSSFSSLLSLSGQLPIQMGLLRIKGSP